MYKCNQCGQTFKRAQFGSCSKCGAFQDFSKVSTVTSSFNSNWNKSLSSKIDSASFSVPKKLSDIDAKSVSKRYTTGFEECDRVLGGGIVEDSVILLAGTPGAGKSTMCLAIANNIANSGKTVLYVSGEESEAQISLRAKRMGVNSENIIVAHETHAEAVLYYCEQESPDFCIIDSIQTLGVESVKSSPGSLAQSKAVADILTLFAKKEKIAMFLISQVVKSEEFAGSKAIQHIVDVTLKLDLDKESPLRFLRAEKNRFGSTDEVGVFQHVDSGLEEITDPTSIAIDKDSVQGTSGTAISMFSEGNRFFPVEIQALTIPSSFNNPRKMFSGLQHGKAHGICAIIDKYCGTQISDEDVYMNTVAGISINSPTCDLAVAASLITSTKNLDMPEGYCYIGELSLTGGVRRTFNTVQAATEAIRLGYKKIVIPNSAKEEVQKQLSTKFKNYNDVTIIPVKTIFDLNSIISKEGKKNINEASLMKEATREANKKKYYKARERKQNKE